MKRDLKIQYIDIEKIESNPYQPRKIFDQQALEDLADSIKIHGLMQPITVRRVGDTYELIAGERRLKASKIIGLSQIEAVITEIDTKNSAVLALIENIQRENLSYLEESEALDVMVREHGYTQQELAKTLGKNQSTIANKLRLLKLPLSVKDKLQEAALTERHARALLKLSDEALQLQVIDQVVRFELNVKKTEQLIDYMLVKETEEEKEEKEIKRQFKMILRDIRPFTNTITQAVDMMKHSGIDVEYKLEKEENGYEIRIKIPVIK